MRLDVVIMVRNGAETLERALDSVLGQVDRIVSYMAGESTDDTAKILDNYGAQVEHAPWDDNFADARNRAFDFARRCGTDWALLMDADDTLVHGDLRECVGRLVEHHCAAGFATISFGGLKYQQKRLFDLSKVGKWVGRAHEAYIGEGATEVCDEVEIVHERSTGVSDPGRNLRIMSKWHEEAPQEFDGHTYYNYANELMWAGRWTDAARMYDYSVSLSAWDDEKYFALLRRGQCLVNTREWSLAWACYVAAAKLKLEWKDAYLEMSRWFYYQELWEMSIVLSVQASLKDPAQTIMPVDHNNYTIGQAIYDSYALGKLERYFEALRATADGLKYDPTNKMLLHNLEIYRKRCAH